jgi:hypothetical protein
MIGGLDIMSSKAPVKIDESIPLEWGAKIGAAARNDNVKAAQMEGLIASLDVIEGREALLATAAFAMRQAQRLGTGQTMARLVVQAMLDIYEKGGGKEEARRALGFAKWVYEASPRGFRGRPDQLTLADILKQMAGR